MPADLAPSRFLGICVMPEWFQCEAINGVLDRLQAAGAQALVTSAYLLEITRAGDGAREPPPDNDAGGVRPLDRPLWGAHETWVRTAPSLAHDLARYRGLRYQPSAAGALTQAHPRRVDRIASLASSHVPDYGATLLGALAQRYPGVHGLQVDWPEYPPLDVAHPVGRRAQVDKRRSARQRAGNLPVIAFPHSYGPPHDVQQRFATAVSAFDGDTSARLWVNRYGYLSATKLAQLTAGMGRKAAGV